MRAAASIQIMMGVYASERWQALYLPSFLIPAGGRLACVRVAGRGAIVFGHGIPLSSLPWLSRTFRPGLRTNRRLRKTISLIKITMFIQKGQCKKGASGRGPVASLAIGFVTSFFAYGTCQSRLHAADSGVDEQYNAYEPQPDEGQHDYRCQPGAETAIPLDKACKFHCFIPAARSIAAIVQ